MKKNIHPTMRPTIFIDSSCGVEFKTMSTVASDETREENGTTYVIYRTEISSASHPFYTGKQTLIDTARRVEKFQEKIAQAKSTAPARKGKKAKRTARAAKKTVADAA